MNEDGEGRDGVVALGIGSVREDAADVAEIEGEEDKGEVAGT
jgi:hypothetical protein